MGGLQSDYQHWTTIFMSNPSPNADFLFEILSQAGKLPKKPKILYFQ